MLIVAGAWSVVSMGGTVCTHLYRITIAGGLGKIGRQAFGEFLIEPRDGNTVLTANLDQPALHGTLNRILSLGLELVELSRLTARPNVPGQVDTGLAR